MKKDFVGEKAGFKAGSVKDCINHCDKDPKCQSFHYQKTKNECYFKKKMLDGSEPLGSWNEIFTVYKVCKEGENDYV